MVATHVSQGADICNKITQQAQLKIDRECCLTDAVKKFLNILQAKSVPAATLAQLHDACRDPLKNPLQALVQYELIDGLAFLIAHSEEIGFTHKDLQGMADQTYRFDRNDTFPLDWTPLHYAAWTGNLDLIEVLIALNPAPLTQMINGFAPLHIALRGGHERAAEVLFEHARTMIGKDRLGYTSLHLAVDKGFEKLVRTLVEQAPQLRNVVDCEKNTPFYHALIAKSESIAGLVLPDDINGLDDRGMAPLHYAAQFGFEALVRLLVDERHVCVDLDNGKGHTPLAYAACSGHRAVVAFLLDRGAVPTNECMKFIRARLCFAPEETQHKISEIIALFDEQRKRLSSEGNGTMLTPALSRHVSLVSLPTAQSPSLLSPTVRNIDQSY